jgi:hypothetical protein
MLATPLFMSAMLFLEMSEFEPRELPKILRRYQISKLPKYHK